ncbi:hypothetical protein F5Y01DRAFT_320724 [Xylaria sp. FL0043]|nr:hypothetical protein F5Y01DRAFT_320724 [Xylaria sp. FL0043]
MADQNSPATCLSVELHDDNVKDHVLHFLGCIPIRERDSFLNDDSHPFFDSEVKHNIGSGRSPQEALELARSRRSEWSAACRKQLRRIEVLWEAMAQDEGKEHFIECILKSGRKWRESRNIASHVGSVTEHTARQQLFDRLARGQTTTDFELEKDVKASVMQFENAAPSNNDSYGAMGSFSKQEIALADLFDEKLGVNNPLYKEMFPNRIKYFHIPHNNMVWAEESLARYYNKPKLDPYASKRMKEKWRKSELDTILDPEYWTGQQQEGRELNSRFIRPMCKMVHPNRSLKEHGGENIVLFMPYLHWETSRNQKHISEVNEDIYYDKIRLQKEQEKQALDKRRRERARATDTSASSNGPEQIAMNIQPPRTRRDTYLWRDIGDIVPFLLPTAPSSRLRRGAHGRLRLNNNLAQYLLDAARLYKAMSLYTDTEVHRKYLTAHPPLHPRRTLDRAYHWSSTKITGRDRDQVVFRATAARPGEWHRFDPYYLQWEGHEHHAWKDICDLCASNIRKVPRLLMVDQLWMWILDANTVVTCFPARYGSNLSDCSDVYKSVEARCSEEKSVTSVFDLALIIIEECSNAMLSFRPISNERPDVVKAFSEAISDINLNLEQTSRRVWQWMDFAQRKNAYSLTASTFQLLSVQREFEIEVEIKDIREELKMLQKIMENQIMVLQQLIDVSERILISPRATEVDHSQGASHTSTRASEGGTLSKDVAPQASSRRGVLSVASMEAEKVETYYRFRTRADEILASLRGHAEQLQELDKNAEEAETKLKDLSELKQNHLNTVQAWQSAMMNDYGLRQGRSVFAFTIVTIIFLPLSFLSSVFGMNSAEFSEGNTMTLREQFTYIFTISAGVVVLAVFCSLSETVQSAALWIYSIWMYIYNIMITTFLVRTGLYALYSFHLNLPSSQRMYESSAMYTQKMKFEARATEQRKLTKIILTKA